MSSAQIKLLIGKRIKKWVAANTRIHADGSSMMGDAKGEIVRRVNLDGCNRCNRCNPSEREFISSAVRDAQHQIEEGARTPLTETINQEAAAPHKPRPKMRATTRVQCVALRLIRNSPPIHQSKFALSCGILSSFRTAAAPTHLAERKQDLLLPDRTPSSSFCE